MLLKSVIIFDQQDYPNKELVISHPRSDSATKTLLQQLIPMVQQQITVLEHEDDLSVGAAKNAAVLSCSGEYICVWDDDDFYHPMRVKYQYNNMQVNGQYKEACILSRIVLYNLLTDQAYLSETKDWAGTLLCRKELVGRIPFQDSDAEDADITVSLLSAGKYLHRIDNFALLYTFIYHGNNTTDYAKYQDFTHQGTDLDVHTVNWVRLRINQQFEIKQQQP